MYRSLESSSLSPSGEGLGEAIGIIARFDNPISGHAELVYRSESAYTIDADSGSGVNIEDLVLARGSSVQASLPEIL